MRSAIIALLGVAVGFSAAWLIQRPEELEGIKLILKETGMSETEFIETYRTMLEDALHREERAVAIISKAALRRLEEGELEKAEEFLARNVALYYLSYVPSSRSDIQHESDRSRTLISIERNMRTSPVLETAINEMKARWKEGANKPEGRAGRVRDGGTE